MAILHVISAPTAIRTSADYPQTPGRRDVVRFMTSCELFHVSHHRCYHHHLRQPRASAAAADVAEARRSEARDRRGASGVPKRGGRWPWLPQTRSTKLSNV